MILESKSCKFTLNIVINVMGHRRRAWYIYEIYRKLLSTENHKNLEIWKWNTVSTKTNLMIHKDLSFEFLVHIVT